MNTIPEKPHAEENESAVLRKVRDSLNRLPDVRVLRNNVGRISYQRIASIVSAALALGPGAVQRIVTALIKGLGRPWSWGLGEGSSDLIGVVRGDGASVPIAIEVKAARGTMSPEQEAWQRAATSWGVVCGVARSVEDAMLIVERARERGRR